MKNIETIANAGNTEIPCHLVIKYLGYELSRTNAGKENELWIAENVDVRFVASNQLELLGLIYMRTIRGQNWKASDLEIDKFLDRYYPKALEK